MISNFLCLGFIIAGEEDFYEFAKRRESKEFASFNLLLIEFLVVSVCSAGNCRMLGQIGLDDDLTWQLGSSSSTCNLCDELKDVFTGSKVWNIERTIGIEYANKCAHRKVEALCNHLRSNQKVCFSRAEGAIDFFVAAFVACCISIKAERSDFWE